MDSIQIAAKKRGVTISTEDYEEMIDHTLLSVGNNYRLKKVIERARNGEKISIGFLGGSLTEGGNSVVEKNFATLSSEYFRDTYTTNPEAFQFVNAGVGGCTSAYANMRYDRDVVKKLGCDPDILFLDFGVNDHEEPTKGKALESLIRRVLLTSKSTAIIVVFVVAATGWNNQEEVFSMLDYYHISMISYRDGLNWAIQEKKCLTSEDYFTDIYHPDEFGHQFMAESITNLWNLVDASELDAEQVVTEETYFGNLYEHEYMIEPNMSGELIFEGHKVFVDSGSFVGRDQEVAVLYYSKGPVYPNNWMHEDGEGAGNPFIIKGEFKTLILLYKSTRAELFGSVDIIVDGELQQTLASAEGGHWENGEIRCIITDSEVKEHTVEFRMAEGDEDKRFTILALGISV